MLTTLLILTAINAQRTSQHLPPLRTSPTLQIAAQAKVNDEVRQHYFAHTSPQGKNVWGFVGYGHGYYVLGENLAKGYDTVPALVNAWMNSPTHRANILDRDFKETGFGIAQDGNTTLVSEYFAD